MQLSIALMSRLNAVSASLARIVWRIKAAVKIIAVIVESVVKIIVVMSSSKAKLSFALEYLLR